MTIMRRQCIRGSLLSVAILVVPLVPAPASDWPRFRGPNGTGVAADTDVPVRWTAQDGVRWKTPIPGAGHSSPIIGGGRVFLQSASDDGQARWLVCLDAATGKVLWRQQAPGRQAHTHDKNTLASSTPALDGERVYAAFWDGKNITLCACNFKGELVWSRDLGGFKSQHGAGFSPIVVDDKVVLSNDQDGSAVLLALDARTGQTRWQAERKGYRACYSTPFVLEHPGGDRELIVVSTAAVTSYDPRGGTENWHCKWPPARMPLRTVSSPVLADGLVVATAGDGAGDRLAIGVKPGGHGDVTATNLAWEDRKTLPYVPSPLALGEHVYCVNDKGLATCHAARTGALVWEQRLAKSFTASPILVDGKVYAAADDGSVYVFAAATTFKLLARNSVGEAVSASPAVADNRLYVRGEHHLFCIGKAK
jgi:outer membrane protein assembly factor BamB